MKNIYLLEVMNKNLDIDTVGVFSTLNQATAVAEDCFEDCDHGEEAVYAISTLQVDVIEEDHDLYFFYGFGWEYLPSYS